MDVFTIAILLWSIFILYQVLRIVFGGSWISESIIVALLIFNVSLIIYLTQKFIKIQVSHNFLTRQFLSLATDFKSHRK